MPAEPAPRPTLYLETTIPSYYVARLSNNLLLLAHQLRTRSWWDKHRLGYQLYVSELVYTEVSKGDEDAARRRLELIEGIPVFEITKEASALARDYLREIPLPQKASADALHLAIATVKGMDYLLTWNCRHLARGSVMRILPKINSSHGYSSPQICTPEELIYEPHNLDRPNS